MNAGIQTLVFALTRRSFRLTHPSSPWPIFLSQFGVVLYITGKRDFGQYPVSSNHSPDSQFETTDFCPISLLSSLRPGNSLKTVSWQNWRNHLIPDSSGLFVLLFLCPVSFKSLLLRLCTKVSALGVRVSSLTPLASIFGKYF